ncbi:MAG: hypothetical protein EOP05_10665 [Proteobacteria bacterium]|nr:MAG: hypothetical protein EOP05_10665 [Pseudomonadota bacterium]
MNRRLFLFSTAASAVTLAFIEKINAAPLASDPSQCLVKLDEISAEATYFSRYEHHHQLAIPVSALILPPKEGFKTRTSVLDQGSLDVKAFEQFIKESGLSPALRTHSHEVNFTREELDRIATGEKEVKVTVPTPKGNIAHEFFFTAPRSAIIKVQRGRGSKA